MTITRLRTLPTKSTAPTVDRDAHIIRGVSCAQAVEALGHGMMLDATTLTQLAEQGNAARNGIKSRFTHPGLSSDGLGKYLGRLRDFRVNGDKVLADLHISDRAFNSPSGDLGTYIMDMAEDEPDMFGMSVVIDASTVWQLDGGGEVETDERPDNATTEQPLVRVKQFIACDAVDEPAANRDGMFSTALWATNQLSEQMFGELDNLLAEYGIEPEKAFSFALKYFDARQVNMRGFAMADKKEGQQDQVIDLATLQKEMAAMREALANAEAARTEAEARVHVVETALDASNERVAALEATARNKRFADLSREWFGTGHDTILAGLAEAFGEWSEQFVAYCQQQDAIAVQMADSALFREQGTSRTDDGLSAVERLNAKAHALRAANPSLSVSDAFVQATEQNPDLYRQHIEEMRG